MFLATDLTFQGSRRGPDGEGAADHGTAPRGTSRRNPEQTTESQPWHLVE